MKEVLGYDIMDGKFVEFVSDYQINISCCVRLY